MWRRNRQRRIPRPPRRREAGGQRDDPLRRLPAPPAAAPQPDTLPDAPVTVAALEDQPISAPPAEEPAPAFGCEVAVSAETLAAAMVEVTVKAPCMANDRFTVHHNAMVFTATTDDTGERRLIVPALSETAVFIAKFATGESAVARAEVTALEYYDRAVVQWRGKGKLQLHALEYGAAYGEDGHVWADAPRDMAEAASGTGGFLTRLGDAGVPSPRLAEVYTFPSGTTPRGGAYGSASKPRFPRTIAGRTSRRRPCRNRSAAACRPVN